ncbi:MAG: dihydroorotase [Bacteroidetes bacterium]|nr:dihydroorotase [Bacteroidota bacterium]
MESYFIHDALIVNEGKQFAGSLIITDGRIADIFNGPRPSPFSLPEGTIEIDARGQLLMPGVIDDQVHFRDPGLTEKGDLYTESRAAVAGGVTSFMDMPNTLPKAVSHEILEEKYNLASNKSLANYSFFLGATNDNLDEIKKTDPSRICGLKVFTGASTGNMLVSDPASLEAIFRESPVIIAVHSEDEAIIQANLKAYKERYGDDIPIEAHPLIRSEEACYKSSELLVSLARKHNSRLHLLHLSTARELDLLDNTIPLASKRITGEVCVHHLWFDERDYADLGSRIKWNPAIKTEKDKQGLMEGLINDKIDIVATDHAPHLLKEKENPYTSCPSGAPLVQHSLVAMLAFYHIGKLSLEKIIEKLCHAPAVLYRIRERGFIRKGYFADLALVDLDAPWTVEPENILYKCGWSPLEGVTFRSRVNMTWVNGRLVFDQGKFNETVKGQRLEFSSDI